MLSAVLIGMGWHYSSDNAKTLSTRLLNRIAARVVDRTAAYLEPAEISAALSRMHFQQSEEVRAGDGIRDIEQLFRHLLEVYPQLAMLKGARSGGARRQLVHQDRPPHRSRRAAGAVEVPRRRGGAAGRVPVQRSSYDPRNRPWYKQAKQIGEQSWTEVYLFFTDSCASRLSSTTAPAAGTRP